MKNKTYHQDFLDAPERRRWLGGSLADLFKLLCAEVQSGAPTYRVLPNGACVSMVQDSLGLRSVRIARREHSKTCALKTGATVCSCVAGAFQREVNTFVKHFGIEAWERKEDQQARGVAVVLLEQVPI